MNKTPWDGSIWNNPDMCVPARLVTPFGTFNCYRSKSGNTYEAGEDNKPVIVYPKLSKDQADQLGKLLGTLRWAMPSYGLYTIAYIPTKLNIIRERRCDGIIRFKRVALK